MKNKIRLAIQLLVLVILQISFINNGVLFGYYPNILLVYTIYKSQKRGKIYGGLVGLILGLVYDILASPNFGIKGLSFLIVAYTIGILSEYIFEENIWTSIFYVTIGKFIYEVIQSIIYFFLSYNVEFKNILFNVFSMELLLGIIFFLLIQFFKSNRDRKLNFISRFKNKKVQNN